MPLKEDALAAWSTHKRMLEEHIDEELSKRIRKITGVEEITVSLENGIHVCEAGGIRFVAEINSNATSVEAALTGVRMLGTCPTCGEEAESRILESLMEIGRNIESFMPSGDHLLSHLGRRADHQLSERAA